MRKNRRFIILVVFVIAGFLWAKEQYVVPIIMYHKINDRAGISKLNVTPESFREQISFLKRHDYNVVKLEELAELVKENKDDTEDNILDINVGNVEITAEGKALDTLNLKRYCCRRHMLTHVDLVDII